MTSTPLFLARSTKRVRLAFGCCGPNKSNMEKWFEDRLMGRFGFVPEDGGYFRTEPFYDPEISDLLNALWETQATFGPETRLDEIRMFDGDELKLLIRKWD